MLTKEDVDSWNKLFPDCQINKTNLSNPSEHFLINALVVYLRRFGYQVEPPFCLNTDSKENNRETRLFLVKLARQIDHFLKITDKSYSFTYCDLIRPTPKKTAHMLYILLNYYYYYNLYKEDVFKMAGDRLRKLDELKGLIDDTRREIENIKEENKNMKSNIETLMEEVPIARAKLKELDKMRTQQEEEFQKVKHSHQELKEKLKHLEEQKKLLRKRVVPDEEFQELQKQLQFLKLELAKRKEIELKNVTTLNECKESDARLQNLSKIIEKAHGIIPLRLLEQINETNKQLVRIRKDQQELEAKQNSMLQEIEETNETLKALEQEYQSGKEECEKKQREIESLEERKSILKKINTHISQLEEEDHISECQLEEQKNIAQFLVENISEILAAYED